MSDLHVSPLVEAMRAVGGQVADYHGRPVVRHFGDPAGEYEAATTAAAVFDRSHRTRLRVTGRAPSSMLSGIVTGRMPEPPGPSGQGVRAGEGTYHAVLTPKGKMISDLWTFLPGEETEEGLLLDVPAAGRDGLLEHLSKFLPPRMAKVEDVSSAVASVTVTGPEAADLVAAHALGGVVDADTLRAASEGAYWLHGEPETGVLAVSSREVWPEAFTLYGPNDSIVELWARLREAGATPAGLGVWSTLRVEGGRPLMGRDMDDRTIPVEAGIHVRAIDHGKGCYTGQEVIVRIRDRGHVNRHLRQLRLGDGPAPPAGTELFGVDDQAERVVGRITSAVESPRFGGVVALAYVRRGVDAVRWGDRVVPVSDEGAP